MVEALMPDLALEHDQARHSPQTECEFDPDHLYHEHLEADRLRVEVERLQRLLRRIAQLVRHAPDIAGESNVQHAQHCPRCLADARGTVKLRTEALGVSPGEATR